MEQEHERERQESWAVDQAASANGTPPAQSTAGEAIDLFVVQYGSEGERKRAEYIFNNWEGGRIWKPDGTVRLAENVDTAALHEQLLLKFRPQKVQVHELSSVSPPETPESRSVEETLPADPDATEQFLQYLVAKKNGERVDDGEYEVYSRKGRADIEIQAERTDQGTSIVVRITGQPPVLEHLVPYFKTEIEAFAAASGQ